MIRAKVLLVLKLGSAGTTPAPLGTVRWYCPFNVYVHQGVQIAVRRRSFLAGLAGAIPSLASRASTEARDDRPNIVVILTDDQSRDSIPFMPNLRRYLADEGVTFRNTVIPTPVCSPSRATMLTGRYAHQSGVQRNTGSDGGYKAWKGKGNERRNLLPWFNEAGYRTALIGKYFNGYPDGAPAPRGVDYAAFASTDAREGDGYSAKSFTLTINGNIRNGGGYRTDVLNKLAIDFIDDCPAEKPLFLWLAHKAPHGPYEPDKPYKNDFGGERVPRTPAFNEESVADKPGWVQRGPLDANEEREMDSAWRSTLRLLESVDRGIPEIIRALERTNRLDNTYIFYLSDNGYFFGQHRLWAKAALYDQAAIFPMIVRGPGLPRGVEDTRVASTIDLPATCLQVAGVTPSRKQAGRSLLDEPSRVCALMEVWSMNDPKRPTMGGLRGQDWAWIESEGFEEYYDLTTDPDEVENAVDSLTPARRAALKARLAALRQCRGRGCIGLEDTDLPD